MATSYVATVALQSNVNIEQTIVQLYAYINNYKSLGGPCVCLSVCPRRNQRGSTCNFCDVIVSHSSSTFFEFGVSLPHIMWCCVGIFAP